MKHLKTFESFSYSADVDNVDEGIKDMFNKAKKAYGFNRKNDGRNANVFVDMLTIIGDKMKLSIQGCINIHNSAVIHVRQELKGEFSFE